MSDPYVPTNAWPTPWLEEPARAIPIIVDPGPVVRLPETKLVGDELLSVTVNVPGMTAP